ncbi:MAG: hypothetical protein LBG72_02965 [Spirochaetaceae bacterium]|jgi:hypothetical protein|nr:hypothetical protein [Spirochaetaceae bacterium]
MDKHITVTKLEDAKENDCFVPGTPEYRISLMWPLTERLAALSGNYDTSGRLQRHIAFFRRGEG